MRPDQHTVVIVEIKIKTGHCRVTLLSTLKEFAVVTFQRALDRMHQSEPMATPIRLYTRPFASKNCPCPSKTCRAYRDLIPIVQCEVHLYEKENPPWCRYQSLRCWKKRESRISVVTTCLSSIQWRVIVFIYPFQSPRYSSFICIPALARHLFTYIVSIIHTRFSKNFKFWLKSFNN